jgi:hypothetical protein
VDDIAVAHDAPLWMREIRGDDSDASC